LNIHTSVYKISMESDEISNEFCHNYRELMIVFTPNVQKWSSLLLNVAMRKTNFNLIRFSNRLEHVMDFWS